jgi:hypothetical protein
MVHHYNSGVEETGEQAAWFVYLLPLLDCTAFKIGFSCNPLQRIYSFSNRYFERFNFDQAMLLCVTTCEEARAIETMLKRTLAKFRVDAPSWIPPVAGGHTEWFNAVYFPQAEERLGSLAQANDSAKIVKTSEYIAAALRQSAPSFEQWALHHAYRLRDDSVSVSLGYDARVTPKPLRDWFDAFRFFEVPLFADDPAVRKFVAESVRR